MISIQNYELVITFCTFVTKSNSDIRVTKGHIMEKTKELLEETKGHLEECGQTILAIHDVMDLLNGKWKVSIIACLCYGKRRYSDLLREVKGISGKMLSRELKDLEMNQLITRKVLDTQPISVEYEITEYGYTLRELTKTIAEWGFMHRERIRNN